MTDNETKDSRKTRYTKMALRDSLIELMQTRPILDISVKELCDQADISRSTFYAYYKDQYDLLKQIEDGTLTALEDMLKKYDNKGSARDMKQMVEEMLKYIADNSNSIQVLLSENGDINFQKRFFRRFTDRQKMMKYFVEKPVDEEKNEYYLVFVISGSVALVQHWLKNNMNIPIPELAAMLIKLTQWMG
ncbi:MAG: TetR/AcrR family transcriptional regulator [Treponema sp.]|nr:TetR/AcrR family transcriptional regulator [Treponema sp.]